MFPSPRRTAFQSWWALSTQTAGYEALVVHLLRQGVVSGYLRLMLQEHFIDTWSLSPLPLPFMTTLIIKDIINIKYNTAQYTEITFEILVLVLNINPTVKMITMMGSIYLFWFYFPVRIELEKKSDQMTKLTKSGGITSCLNRDIFQHFFSYFLFYLFCISATSFSVVSIQSERL